MNPLISIIVPVYNTESYLRNCINSVLGQEYKNWELILVDDGSTDSSGKICDEYAAKDSRIRTEHKPNTGVSDTRNRGIDVAKGEWIFFLDSDDILYPYSLSSMIKWGEGVDMVVGIFNLQYISSSSITAKQDKAIGRINKVLTPISFTKFLLDKRYGLYPTLFPRLYRTDIIKENYLKFDTTLFYAEDQLFLAQYICSKKVHKIRFNNIEPVYKYSIREGSAMRSFEGVFNEKTYSNFTAYYKTYLEYTNAFHDREIDLMTKLAVYSSGEELLSLLEGKESPIDGKKHYIEEILSEISKGSVGEYIIKRYESDKSLIKMKRIARTLPVAERAKYVNNWLHSKECFYKGLNRRWKKLYILSLILGSLGVQLVIDRIGFDT